MAKFVQIEAFNHPPEENEKGYDVLLNIDHIVAIYPSDKGSCINTTKLYPIYTKTDMTKLLNEIDIPELYGTRIKV